MTRQDAHTLLNAAKSGADISEQQIIEALQATGDFCQVVPTRCVPDPPPLPLPKAYLRRLEALH